MRYVIGLWIFVVVLVVFLSYFVEGGNATRRHAQRASGWVCPIRYHGEELPPSRANILAGICFRP